MPTSVLARTHSLRQRPRRPTPISSPRPQCRGISTSTSTSNHAAIRWWPQYVKKSKTAADSLAEAEADAKHLTKDLDRGLEYFLALEGKVLSRGGRDLGKFLRFIILAGAGDVDNSTSIKRL